QTLRGKNPQDQHVQCSGRQPRVSMHRIPLPINPMMDDMASQYEVLSLLLETVIPRSNKTSHAAEVRNRGVGWSTIKVAPTKKSSAAIVQKISRARSALAARGRSGISGRRRNSVVRKPLLLSAGNFVSVPKFHFCHSLLG